MIKRIMRLFVISLALCLLVSVCSCDGSGNSGSSGKYTAEELARLKYYGEIHETMNNGTSEEKRAMLNDVMGKVQSGQIPQNFSDDAKRLLNK